MDLRGVESGLLDGWLLTSVGTWWARVHLRLRARNGGLALEQTQLVPADAVRPVAAGDDVCLG